MEDDGISAATVQEAPPGDSGEQSSPVAVVDTGAESVPEAAPADALPDLKDDYSNIDEWLAASERQVNAAAEASESAEATPDSPPVEGSDTAPAVATAAAPKPDAEVPPAPALTAEQIEAAKAAGYTVEPPSPPPDPFVELTAALAPYIGQERYDQLKADALQIIDDTDPDWTTKDAARTKAAAELRQMDTMRHVASTQYRWMREQLAREDAGALESLIVKHPSIDRSPLDGKRGLAPIFDAHERAVTATVSAAKDAEWQARYDARETYWKGQVARAKADKLVSDTGEVARAPQAGTPAGGRAAGPAPLYQTVPGTNLPTEAEIQRMIRGDFAGIDLSR